MRDFVFCVDSDGCAMDTMTYKHQLFFGPIAADVFEIADRATFLAEWDRVNLYSRTRGVNRFVGLVIGLEFAGVANIEKLKNWVETTTSLSNAALEAAIAQEPSEDLQKALAWSLEVNRQIQAYDGEAKAFDGVKEGLEFLHELGKVYVVSSANKEAVQEEWVEQGLLPHTDDLYCQDRGKKEDVIAALIEKGYESNRILMIGDSPGDIFAADQNQVRFYPILVGKEAQSWSDLKEWVAQAFVADTLTAEDYAAFETAFWNNLDA